MRRGVALSEIKTSDPKLQFGILYGGHLSAPLGGNKSTKLFGLG